MSLPKIASYIPRSMMQPNFTKDVTFRGILKDCLSCTVYEERNGSFYLEMTYPVGGKFAEYLQMYNVIICDAGTQLKNQQFRITRIKKTSDLIISVYAEHVSYITYGLLVEPTVNKAYLYTAELLTLWYNNILNRPFDFNVVSNFSSNFLSKGVKWPGEKFLCARDILMGTEGSILDIVGGEYLFDNYNITLKTRRGKKIPKPLYYGHGIVDIECEEIVTDSFQSVQMYANSGSGVVWGIPNSNKKYDDFPYLSMKRVDASSQFNSETVQPAELTNAASSYMQSNSDMVRSRYSFRVNTAALQSDPAFVSIGLCDSVTIDYEPLNIKLESKVTAYHWNVLTDSYTDITLGNYKDIYTYQK